MAIVTRAGVEWEIEKYNDIQEHFPSSFIIGETAGTKGYNTIPLNGNIQSCNKNCFIMQSEYGIAGSPCFESNFSISTLKSIVTKLEFSNCIPDIIQVMLPDKSSNYDHYVSSDGKYLPLKIGDKRKKIKIIDIKHTAEPSISHFSEIAYYMLTLACWLEDNNLDEFFCVVAGAIWPGSHDASQIRKGCIEKRKHGGSVSETELLYWFDLDLIEIPFEVFSSKIKKFFIEDLKDVLTKNWWDFDYHVGPGCKHCDYLGYPWLDSKGNPTFNENHCMQLALKDDHLSRIADLSKGARVSLNEGSIASASQLSQLTYESDIFNKHQTLKAKRVLYPQRAISLKNNQVIIPDAVGTSSVMPKWADLSIFLSVDFDVSSAITACIGVKGVWVNPLNKKELIFWPRDKKQNARVFVVEDKDIDREKDVLIDFLKFLQAILDDARNQDIASSFQIYIWDNIQYEHFQRIISRHLEAIIQTPEIKNLIWLFPPEESVQNPDLQRQSPITIVKDCYSSLTALPISHFYSLLMTARMYGDPDYSNSYSIHPLFEDALSDQIPSERIHEIWTKIDKPYLSWVNQLIVLKETVDKKIKALHKVTQRLQTEIRSKLIETAPPLTKSLAPKKQGKMFYNGELLYMYTKLDVRLSELDNLAKRSLPAYEREAKFDSAILQFRIEEKTSYLRKFGIDDNPYIFVYKLNENSKDVRIKEGDFLLALSPNCDATFLNKKIGTILNDICDNKKWATFDWILNVNILVIDRENGILIFKINPYRDMDNNPCNPIYKLENKGYSFAKDISIDPIHRDYFTKKLLDCLQDIGNPTISMPTITEAEQFKQTGLTAIKARKRPITPAASLLWEIEGRKGKNNKLLLSKDYDQINALLDDAANNLNDVSLSLNDSQKVAWKKALKENISIIWGPPGTGKSRTLVSLVQSYFYIARIQRCPLRILLSAFTYNAIDNVLVDIAKKTNLDDVALYRLSSEGRTLEDGSSNIIQISTGNNKEISELQSKLNNNQDIMLVAAPSQQVYNLLKVNNEFKHREFFDCIIIDEASQMSVANAVLTLSSATQKCSLVLAGDGLQLPPILKAEIPIGCENKVGSVYDYYTKGHSVEPSMLSINYRSNNELVEFIKEAGYKNELTSYSPDLKIRLNKQTKIEWPEELFYCTGWEDFIDPKKSICCFTYLDGMSSQWNDFEVGAIACICTLLNGRLFSQLENEKGLDGKIKPLTDSIYSEKEFWEKGVGIVTPHRAQQSKVINTLEKIFSHNDAELRKSIRNSVDTVERYQGQQRDIIIASYSLGDIDMIGGEEEFILSLKRFNVMVSRARAKAIVFISEELAYYLGSDIDVLNESKLINKFANTYCDNEVALTLGYKRGKEDIKVKGKMKYM